MKKKMAVLSAALMIFACNAIPIMADDHASSFADLSDHWAKNSVAIAIAKKYVDGYGDGTFRPENYVSTAEFIKMVVTATKLPVTGNTEGREWYVPYVKAAVDKGIVQEDSVNIDVLNMPISRVEMSKIAVRATDPTLQQKYVNLNNQGAMFTAASKGLIQGLAKGELAPDGSTTRAQSVTIIERILSLNSGEKLETDKLAISNAELAFKRTNLFSMIPVFGGKQYDENMWNPSKLVMETPDGKYKGVIDQIIAIDMANPNDPNWEAAGDISNLKWWVPGTTTANSYIKDYPDSYLIVVKRHVEFSKDPNAYGDMPPFLNFYGIKSPDLSAANKGTLNSIAEVFVIKPGDTSMYIIPKSGFKTNVSVQLDISAPAIPPQKDYGRTIVDILAPKTN
ncbi:S-layer homology domain-containing protein [Paenibacillus sedimenti]|uniref:S-layer homology domain-containing protein n=1 Tax=Paenibacillus sedimenti TaxID=2770274 RepID=A0A926KQI5_9BACL|nr:S-layer homology domain-containing protein [Paenibacillus sedimenti]MBD0381081.1 S-layer homology domain-containing protein [Paenibacillus sedimenti]